MTSGAPWPMAVTPLGPVAAGTAAFRTRGRIHVAAIVKACFSFVPDRPMAPADPEPIVMADQHRDKMPVRGLAAASELAPYRARADVLLHGHACAYQGQPLRAFAVRLMMAQGGRTILDKRLAVQGAKDRRTGEITAFARMPLSWELASSGPDPEENPAGIADRGGDEANIFDPQRRGRPAGFEPIPERWPLRRKLLGPIDPRLLRGAIPDLPDTFPWAYFQAAPADQRIDFLRGDEWIALEGMHPEVTRLTSCLPGVRGVARFYGPTPDLAAGRPIAMVADTLTIDADRRRCSVVWRGSFPLASEDDLRRLQVLAGVEIAGRPVAFPATYAPPAATGLPATSEVPAQVQARIQRASALPFEPAPPAGASRPPTHPGAQHPPPQHKDSGTMAMPAFAPIDTAATPFEHPAPAATPFDRTSALPPSVRPPRVAALDQTIVPEERAPAAATPFELQMPRPVSRSRPGVFDSTAAAPPPVNLAPATPFERPSYERPAGPTPPPSSSLDLLSAPRLAPSRPGVFDQTVQPVDAPPRPATPFERPLVPPAPPRVTPPPIDPAEIEVPQAAYMPHDAHPREDLEVARASVPPPVAPPSLAPPPQVTGAGEGGEAPATLGAHFLAAMARAGQAPAAHA